MVNGSPVYHETIERFFVFFFRVNETIERDSWGSRRRTSSSARSWAGPLSQARGRWFPLAAHKALARSTAREPGSRDNTRLTGMFQQTSRAEECGLI